MSACSHPFEHWRWSRGAWSGDVAVCGLCGEEAARRRSTVRVPAELVEAQDHEHRMEVARLQMQLVRYREALEEAGIEPPDSEAAELLAMWRECRAVISTASEFVAYLGTAKELLR